MHFVIKCFKSQKNHGVIPLGQFDYTQLPHLMKCKWGAL